MINLKKQLKKNKGSTLLLVVIFIAVMSLVVIANMKSTVFQEKASSAQYDRSLSFQAAEAALREAEQRLAQRPVFPETGCTAGLCAREEDLTGLSAPLWQDDTVAWSTSDDVVVSNDDVDITVQPEYVVEAMGLAPNWPGCDRELPISPNCMSPNFRITAKTVEEGRSEVVLQSSFSLPGN